MNKNDLPITPATKQLWTTGELTDTREENRFSFFHWWYRMTAVPEPPPESSFTKREHARRIRMLSIVTFYLILVLIIFFPACFLLPNAAVVVPLDGSMILVSGVALILNRYGKVIEAGAVIVILLELALMVLLLTTYPLDEVSMALYDLFIMVELLAVSLLPVRSVFLVAISNVLFIFFDILFQAHTPGLERALQLQFGAIAIRPIGLQILVAGVSYLWVTNTNKAIARADKVEMIAKLEHALVDQQRQLQEGIEEILQTHVQVANGNLNARAPLSQAHVLWQLARALNTLLVRLQRAVMAEKELQRTQNAVAVSVGIIQEADNCQEKPKLMYTKTSIDPLIAALQGKTIASTPPIRLQQRVTAHPQISYQKAPEYGQPEIGHS